MSAHLNTELNDLLVCVAATFGDSVGEAVNEKIAAVLALEGVDIAAVQAQIATLNSLLASNTAGDTTTAQSILAALTAIGNRVTTLEGSTAVADLTAVVAGLQAALATETQNRLDADAALQQNITSLQVTVDGLTQSIVSIQAEIAGGTGSGACDCTALTAAIAEAATAITNLQASDAQQATQIAALQAAVVALQTQAADIATAQATATAALAAAQAAAAAGGAAQSTATQAISDAAAAGAAAAAAGTAAADAAADVEAVKAAIRGVNCVVVGGHFRHALRSRLGLAD